MDDSHPPYSSHRQGSPRAQHQGHGHNYSHSQSYSQSHTYAQGQAPPQQHSDSHSHRQHPQHPSYGQHQGHQGSSAPACPRDPLPSSTSTSLRSQGHPHHYPQQQQQSHSYHSQHSQHSQHHPHSHQPPHQHSQSHQQFQYSHSSAQLQPSELDAWRSPITPTTTRKFNRMAIHEVLDGHQQGHPQGHGDDRASSPAYKRKGSPEESSFSDPSLTLRSHQHRVDPRQHSDHYPQPPLSPRYRQESPMPGSNSDDDGDDDDDDRNNNKKRRMVMPDNGYPSSSRHPHPHSHSQAHLHPYQPPSSQQGISQSSPGGAPEVMDQVRTTLKLKQQQKAIIESRQSVQQQGQGQGQGGQGPSTLPSQQPQSQQQHGAPKSSQPLNGNQPITEKTPSGLSVFHGSASFALSRRPVPSPKNPKNAKSLTIFAPSYSESSLSIHSAPLQPSQSHQQALGSNPRTSHPLHMKHPHPYAQQTASSQQPLRSPRTIDNTKKSSRTLTRPPGSHAAGMDHSSGTLPAPILSSHTGPLPSPSMYPHPSTPFHSTPKQHFMDTVSTLFDSVDSTRSLKFTLEEQIRKSAQLLQTLQSSGTMIESLVRGQFKELEKGVIERFENEIEYLSARVRRLEEHQGLTPPPRKAKSASTTGGASVTTTTATSSLTAMTGITPLTGSGGGSGNGHGATVGEVPPSALSNNTSLNNGTLPTPPLTKTLDSSMDIEEDVTAQPAEKKTLAKQGEMGQREET